MTVSALALQAVLGVPLFLGAYSRSAYAVAQSSCTYSPANGSIGENTSVSCSIPSGTTNAPQLFYSGARVFNTSGDTFHGLAMTVTNQATIAQTSDQTNQVMAPSGMTGFKAVTKGKSLGALYAGSKGSTNMPNDGGVGGGAGGALTLNNYASIAAGNYGYGILVYSAGGQGSPKTKSTSQKAGSGGAGGNITIGLFNSSRIAAGSNGGAGVAALSIGNAAGGSGDYALGGAGGTIGISVSGTQTIGTQSVGTLVGDWQSGGGIVAVSKGGKSAFKTNGPNGGSVSLSGSGAAVISTQSASSPGIYLVSQGGTAQNSSYTGGTGGAVTVGSQTGYFSAGITTQGNYAPGLVAQSLGGPGSTGRNSNGSTSGYANGGIGGGVAVHLQGTGASGPAITTYGTQSHGLVAQSLGAGGGTYATGAAVVGDQNSTSKAGAAVTVGNQAGIQVSGNYSHGILAQSIGGAGGSVYTSASTGTSIGGQSGGAGGNAVTVTNAGGLSTGGIGGIGILAQSIGGGGANAVGSGLGTGLLRFGGSGNNGGSGSNGGAVNLTNTGAISTTAYDAPAIEAQSIGGGGGQGRNKKGLFAAVGGSGGPGGAGGAATATNQGGRIAVSGDYSDGLFVQSIGGGGGNGGKATSWGTLLSFSHGGAGGSGGAGGNAYGYATAKGGTASNISTQGLKSSGIVVQSVGGGGGAGGSSKASAAGVLTIAVSLGGSGGSGGAGGTAKASALGNVTTYGYDAVAVIAQSIGGGGGNGGSASAQSFGIDVPVPGTDVSASASISIATGGTGGSGGNGGNAYAVNASSATTQTANNAITSSNGVNPGTASGNTIAAGTSISGITTFGDGATGMLVQSIGGGGGNGGDSTATSSAGVLQQKLANVYSKVSGHTPKSTPQANLTIAVAHGGKGGAAGTGATAGAKNKGAIGTYGMFADGIIVQSIGGGGGNGGSGNAKTNATGTSVSLSVALGGFASGGGVGGVAYAGNLQGATIRTLGNNSRGIMVQSIGGGGGNAGGGAGSSTGTLGLTVALGHSGSGGGAGANAYAYNAGSITTQGDWSDGILVQSIGGGGGNAGAGDSSLTVPSASAFKNAFPADDSNSSATTSTASTAGQNTNPTTLGTFTLSLGSPGGSGGDGGNVTVGFTKGASASVANYTATGSIVTSGTLSHGVLAQSIGGGGGNAASSPGSSGATANLYLGASGGTGGSGGSVKVFTNNVTTYGFSSHGVLAQSIGGGGGTGVASGVNATVTSKLGTLTASLNGTASSGSAGSGGPVTVYSLGRIVTGKTQSGANATDSFGILAQSIGGGGGMTAAAQGSSISASNQGGSASVTITLGAKGLTGTADGGAVSVKHSGSITTYGARNFGIVAQSIGGGGGIQSGSGSTMNAVTFNAVSSSGTGGAVAVTLGANASITTSGSGAFGILAQSIGGGGGFAADATHTMGPASGATPGGSTKNAGGGDVTVTVGSGVSISTSGYNAHGIFAQSVGGGGGVWWNGTGNTAGSLQGDNSSVAVGQLAVTVDGSVSVAGNDAWGVYATSDGTYSGSNAIVVTVNGSVSGTGAGGGAILMRSQANNNQIVLNGTLEGNVFNQGGLQDYTAGVTRSTLTNNGNNTLITRDYVKGLNVVNNGTMNIGGTGRFQTTFFSNDLRGSGLIKDFDVDFAGGRSDRIDVAGTLAGGVTGPLRISLNVLTLQPGPDLAVIRAGALAPGQVVFLDPYLLYDFQLQAPAGSRDWYRLKVVPQFGTLAAGLAPNLEAVANHLTAAWNWAAVGGYDPNAPQGGGPTMNQVFNGFTSVHSVAAYRQLLPNLLANAVMGQVATQPNAAFALASSALSCPSFVGAGTFLAEQECVWADVGGTWGEIANSEGVRGLKRTSSGIQVGGQKRLAPDWFLGASLTYDQARSRSRDDAEHLDTDTYGLALALKRQWGPWYFAGVLGGGHATGDGKRLVSLGTASWVASASPDSDYLFARARVAYEFTQPQTYVRPLLDLDVVQLHRPGYRESGAGALGLAFDGVSRTLFTATPAVEIGGRIDTTAGTVLRPYAFLGLSLLSDDRLDTQARLIGAAGTPSFTIEQPMPDVIGRLRLGLDVQAKSGLGVKLEYSADLADGYTEQSGELELTYRF